MIGLQPDKPTIRLTECHSLAQPTRVHNPYISLQVGKII